MQQNSQEQEVTLGSRAHINNDYPQQNFRQQAINSELYKNRSSLSGSKKSTTSLQQNQDFQASQQQMQSQQLQSQSGVSTTNQRHNFGTSQQTEEARVMAHIQSLQNKNGEIMVTKNGADTNYYQQPLQSQHHMTTSLGQQTVQGSGIKGAISPKSTISGAQDKISRINSNFSFASGSKNNNVLSQRTSGRRNQNGAAKNRPSPTAGFSGSQSKRADSYAAMGKSQRTLSRENSRRSRSNERERSTSGKRVTKSLNKINQQSAPKNINQHHNSQESAAKMASSTKKQTSKKKVTIVEANDDSKSSHYQKHMYGLTPISGNNQEDQMMQMPLSARQYSLPASGQQSIGQFLDYKTMEENQTAGFKIPEETSYGESIGSEQRMRNFVKHTMSVGAQPFNANSTHGRSLTSGPNNNHVYGGTASHQRSADSDTMAQNQANLRQSRTQHAENSVPLRNFSPKSRNSSRDLSQARNVPTHHQQTSSQNHLLEPNMQLQVRLLSSLRYGELCERRILDFDPNHPLPVCEEHLGMSKTPKNIKISLRKQSAAENSGSRERRTLSSSRGELGTTVGGILLPPTHHAKGMSANPSSPSTAAGAGVHSARTGLEGSSQQQFDQLNGSPRALKCHVDGLQQKNQQLEKALRAETLANEEQRNYIQILRNVIEQKMDRDGLADLVKEFKNSQTTSSGDLVGSSEQPLSGRKDDPVDLYLMLSQMRNQASSQNKDTNRLVDQLQQMTEQSRQIIEENKSLKQVLQNKESALKHLEHQYSNFENQMDHLNRQKNELLDCVENQVQQIETLKSEVVEERRRSSSQVPAENINSRLKYPQSSATSESQYGKVSSGASPQNLPTSSVHIPTNFQQNNSNPHNNEPANYRDAISVQNQNESQEMPQFDANQFTQSSEMSKNLHHQNLQNQQNNLHIQQHSYKQVHPVGADLGARGREQSSQEGYRAVSSPSTNHQQEMLIHSQNAAASNQNGEEELEYSHDGTSINRTLLSNLNGNGQNGLISAPNSHFMPVQQQNDNTTTNQHHVQSPQQMIQPAIMRSQQQSHAMMHSYQQDRRTDEMLHAEIEKLHGKLMVANQEICEKQEEIDQLTVDCRQTARRFEIEQQRNQERESDHVRVEENARALLTEEQRRIEDLQTNFEAKQRKLQRDLVESKEVLSENQLALEQSKKAYERSIAELQLKNTQIEGLQAQGTSDKIKLRDLEQRLEDADAIKNRLEQKAQRIEHSSQLDQQSKDQTNKEKSELMESLTQMQHEVEILKSKHQAEILKLESKESEAKNRLQFVEKLQKKNQLDNEMLAKDLAASKTKQKSVENQCQYLETSVNSLHAEIRQNKLDLDEANRDKLKLSSQISDLQAELEQLYRNEERSRRLHEKIQELNSSLKEKEDEVESLDRKLRHAYQFKEEFENEGTSLRKLIAELKTEKATLYQQKEVLGGQTTASEKRIFELTKDKQEQEQKVREFQTLLKCATEERNKYQKSCDEKEAEIGDLSKQIKYMRIQNTDLILIEEKVDVFLKEIAHVLEQAKRQQRDYLVELLRTVKVSESLSVKIPMRLRESGHQKIDSLEASDLSSVEGGVSLNQKQDQQDGMSQIWTGLQRVKESVENYSQAAHFANEILQILVADCIQSASELTRKERKNTALETRLASIHSVDFKAQTTCDELKKTLLDLKRDKSELETTLQVANQRLKEDLQSKMQELSITNAELTTLKSQLVESVGQMTTRAAKSDYQATSNQIHSHAERVRMAEFVERLRKLLFSQDKEGDEIMRQMLESVLVLAHSDAERIEVIQQIEQLELGLVDLMDNNINQGQQEGFCESQTNQNGNSGSNINNIGRQTTNDQIDKIRKVKDLRSKLNAREEDIRLIDERVGLENARLKTLEEQLSEIPVATTTQGRRTNCSPSVGNRNMAQTTTNNGLKEASDIPKMILNQNEYNQMTPTAVNSLAFVQARPNSEQLHNYTTSHLRKQSQTDSLIVHDKLQSGLVIAAADKELRQSHHQFRQNLHQNNSKTEQQDEEAASKQHRRQVSFSGETIERNNITREKPQKVEQRREPEVDHLVREKHMVDSYLDETKDLRQRLLDKQNRMGGLGTELKNMKTYGTMKFERTDADLNQRDFRNSIEKEYQFRDNGHNDFAPTNGINTQVNPFTNHRSSNLSYEPSYQPPQNRAQLNHRPYSPLRSRSRSSNERVQQNRV